MFEDFQLSLLLFRTREKEKKGISIAGAIDRASVVSDRVFGQIQTNGKGLLGHRLAVTVSLLLGLIHGMPTAVFNTVKVSKGRSQKIVLKSQ